MTGRLVSLSYDTSELAKAINTDMKDAFGGLAWRHDSFLAGSFGAEKAAEQITTMLYAGPAIGLAEEYLFDLGEKWHKRGSIKIHS